MKILLYYDYNISELFQIFSVYPNFQITQQSTGSIVLVENNLIMTYNFIFGLFIFKFTLIKSINIFCDENTKYPTHNHICVIVHFK